MNSLVICPGCGFRGQLPDALSGLKTMVCPNCRIAVPVSQLRRHAAPAPDESLPIFVDGTPSPRGTLGERITPPVPATVSAPTPEPRAAQTEPRAARVELRTPQTQQRVAQPAAQPTAPPEVLELPPEEGSYTGEYMKDEAGRFAQYVATRLGELHKRRRDLAEAENKFESTTMERKQEIQLQRVAVAAEAERLKEREAALQAKETALTERVAGLAAREAEVASRKARVARAEARVADTDRRTADLRAAIDQLEAKRAAAAEERTELDRRAADLDKAELALQRRSAEVDEMDERLRIEQEEFDREREQAQEARQQME